MTKFGKFCYSFLGFLAAARTQRLQSSPFDAVAPSDELKWHACYNDLFCARLVAPLDYQDSNLGEAIIPLVKIPAAVDASDDAYRGMVIFSPGGFGLSGINVTIENRDMIRPMVGANSDIVAFDPRGFGLSSPSIACSSLDPRGSNTGRSVPRLADRFAEDKLAAAIEAGENCKQMVGGPTDAGPHSSTATIARDVMRIVDAYSRTVDGKAAPDEGNLLNFLGWSFATYIGQTIASMFPDRIGGMVLDGMVDPISSQANFTSNSVNDVDGIIASFFVYCAEAGPEQCPYYTGTSPMDIWKRFSKSFMQLDAACGDVQREDALLSLKAALIAFVYSPLALFPQMAHVLLALEEALESKALSDWTEDVRASIDPSFLGNVSIPAMAVVCPEQGNRWYGEELQAFQPLIEETKMQSIVGELYGTSVILGCHGWSIDSSEVYDGPFGGQTRNPILFISNTYDFPCPKKNSFSAASRFTNSKAFIIDGIGHVSFATGNSCAAATTRQYFQEGKMPEADGCPLQVGPFGVMLNGTITDNIVDAGLSDLVGLLSEAEVTKVAHSVT